MREVALGYSAKEMAAAFKDKDRLRYEEFLQVIDGKTTGAARASIGLATTFADVYKFWEFAARFRDLPSDAVEAPSGPERRPPAARPDVAGVGAFDLCLGCEIHGLLVRRGLAKKDEAYEVCAHGACDVAPRRSS